MNALPHLARLALVVSLAGCIREPGPEPAAEAPAHDEPLAESDHHIELSPTVRRNLGITFAEVEVRHVAETLRVPGPFELQPLARHEYRIALPGQVELLVDQYARVERGTIRPQLEGWQGRPQNEGHDREDREADSRSLAGNEGES